MLILYKNDRKVKFCVIYEILEGVHNYSGKLAAFAAFVVWANLLYG